MHRLAVTSSRRPVTRAAAPRRAREARRGRARPMLLGSLLAHAVILALLLFVLPPEQREPAALAPPEISLEFEKPGTADGVTTPAPPQTLREGPVGRPPPPRPEPGRPVAPAPPPPPPPPPEPVRPVPPPPPPPEPVRPAPPGPPPPAPPAPQPAPSPTPPPAPVAEPAPPVPAPATPAPITVRPVAPPPATPAPAPREALPPLPPPPEPPAAPRARAPHAAPLFFPFRGDFSFAPSQSPAPSRPEPPFQAGGAIDLALGPIARSSHGAPPRAVSTDEYADIRVSGAQVGPDWIELLHEWWVTHSRYPNEAIRLGQDGTVGVHLVVDRYGRVEAVELISRSGSQWLDLESLAIFRGAHLPPFPPETPEPRADIDLTINYILIRR